MAIHADLTIEKHSQSVLNGLTSTLAPLARLASDFGGILEKEGQVVDVPLYATPGSVADFAGDYTASADLTVTSKKVTIDKHKFLNAVLTDVQKVNTVARLEAQGFQMGAEIAKTVFQDILSLLLTATYSTEQVVLAANFDSDNVVDLKNDLDTLQASSMGRIAVLANAHMNNLLKDTSIKGANVYGGTEIVRGGVIPNLSGLELFQSDAIPANGENLAGFACTPDAIAIAMRYLEPQEPGEYLEAFSLEDPETGVVIGVRVFYDTTSGKKYIAYEVNYGYTAGLDSLTRLVTA